MTMRNPRINRNRLCHHHRKEANGTFIPLASFLYHLLYIYIKNGKMDGEWAYPSERLKHSRGKCGIHAQY